MDALEVELPAAFGLLRRRAGGDYSPDLAWLDLRQARLWRMVR
jgi:hypothetical protein